MNDIIKIIKPLKGVLIDGVTEHEVKKQEFL